MLNYFQSRRESLAQWGAMWTNINDQVKKEMEEEEIVQVEDTEGRVEKVSEGSEYVTHTVTHTVRGSLSGYMDGTPQ